MAEGKLILIYILFLFVLLHEIYSTEGTCLKFDFKNLPKETITRDENSTLRLLFTTVASPPTCANTTLPENFTIVVSKTGEETVGTICEYRHRDRVCLQTLYSNTSCGCNTTERLYSFTKRLTRKDSGKWIWSTKPSGVITSQEMTFNIAYPARVKSIHLRDTEGRELSSVDEGSDVLLICFWEPGRPPTTHEARIVDRHGQKINATNIPNNETRQIRYRYKAVKCADTGTFRCEIPGHNQSKAVTLRVRCPIEITLPQNEMSVIPGGSVVLKANIRSYTRNLTQCTVTKKFRSGNARGPQQCNITDLTGNPPDLTLTIQLDNIQEEEDGEWTLYIANDKGDGQVDFKINIADTSVTLLVAIASGVAALAAVIGFIVVAALMARRFSNGKKGSRSSYRVVLQAKRQIGTDEPRPHSPSPSREVRMERNPPERIVPGACGRVIPDGTDAPDNGEYAEITAGGVSRGVFVGGPMECYTDVVDQLVGAQAPQPDVSSHNYYYVAPDEILDRKQKARK